MKSKYLLIESTGHDIVINEIEEEYLSNLQIWAVEWLESMKDINEFNEEIKEIKAYVREPDNDDYEYIKEILPDKYKDYELNILGIYELEVDFYENGRYKETFNPTLYITLLK